MSNSMTEEKVRAKFGAHFDYAYELLGQYDKHDLIMMELESSASSEGSFQKLIETIKDLDQKNNSEEDTNGDLNLPDHQRLITIVLEEFGNRDPGELAALLRDVAASLTSPSACDREQLYAHVTIDVMTPVTSSAALEMTHLLERIIVALNGAKLEDYKVRLPFKVNTNAKI